MMLHDKYCYKYNIYIYIYIYIIYIYVFVGVYVRVCDGYVNCCTLDSYVKNFSYIKIMLVGFNYLSK